MVETTDDSMSAPVITTTKESQRLFGVQKMVQGIAVLAHVHADGQFLNRIMPTVFVTAARPRRQFGRNPQYRIPKFAQLRRDCDRIAKVIRETIIARSASVIAVAISDEKRIRAIQTLDLIRQWILLPAIRG